MESIDMNRVVNIILIIFLGLSSQISFAQDTTKNTFKVTKIFATAGGLTMGIIDRNALADSGNIVIHGCPDCRVAGFQLSGKVRQVFPKQSIALDSTITPVMDTITLAELYNKIYKSKSDLFTSQMKGYITNRRNNYVVYYIELSNIIIITPEGQQITLNKICLYLQ